MTLLRPTPIDYQDFVNTILTPIHQKLETAPNGVKLKETVYYLVTCYGIPVMCQQRIFHLRNNPFLSSYSCHIRSLDQFLIDIYRQINNGFTPKGVPRGNGNREGPLLGDSRAEVTNLYADVITERATRETVRQYTFKAVRDRRVMISSGSFLVTRLDGMNADIARGLVDNALYAEKYLKYQSSSRHPYRMQVVIDSDERRSHGHERFAAMMKHSLSGDSPYSPWWPKPLSAIGMKRPPFDIIADWGSHRKEIGENGHRPMVRGIVESVSKYAVVLKKFPSSYGVYFFSPGMILTSDAGKTAAVLADDPKRHRLLLDDASPFEPGDAITWEWAGQFPLSPMFIYSFYALGAYRDVYAFPLQAHSESIWIPPQPIRSVHRTGPGLPVH